MMLETTIALWSWLALLIIIEQQHKYLVKPKVGLMVYWFIQTDHYLLEDIIAYQLIQCQQKQMHAKRKTVKQYTYQDVVKLQWEPLGWIHQAQIKNAFCVHHIN